MRIDILLFSFKRHSFERYTAEKIAAAFKKMQVPHSLLFVGDGSLGDYLRSIKEEPPLWTLSMADCFFQKVPLCETTKVPHFYWENGSLSQSIHYLQGAQSFVGFGCSKHSKRCKELNLANLAFLPHGVSDAQFDATAERPFDVVLIDSLVDCADLERTWRELFPEEVFKTMCRSVERCENDKTLLPFEAILQTASEEGIADTGVSLNDLLFGVEFHKEPKIIGDMVEDP